MLTAKTFPVINLAQTGRSIESHRREAGLSVRDLQNYFGFEYPQAIYKWQHGDCLPTVDNLLALSRVLQVPMEDLLVYDDQEVIFILVKPSRKITFNRRETGNKTVLFHTGKTVIGQPLTVLKMYRPLSCEKTLTK